MEDGELVFIATPLMGHLMAQLELGRHLLAQFPQLSIAVLIPKFPVPDAKLDAYLRSSPVNESQISLIELPPLESPPEAAELRSKSPFLFLELLMSLYKPEVKRVVATRRQRTLGILTDMLICQFVDVAEELGVPSYVFFASGANMLAMMLELESRGVHAPSEFGELPSDSAPVEFPGFRNPVPLKVWPEIILHKENFAKFLLDAGRFRKSKGILLNSFTELESEILRSLSGDDRSPPIYTVGPMVHRAVRDADDPVFDWLNAQPPCSVVFLCFGSHGSFGKEQVEQIATGIELSGHRFLWSLRRPPNPTKGEQMSSDFNDFEEILPVGFLERTAGVGKVIGWAPQTEVLAHPSVGAFVSHCGWNSVLESVSFSVPVVTWPIYGEQQLNAFFLVKELGMAVELRMDYRCDIWERKPNMVVMAAEVERGIRKAMEEEEGAAVRKKVKEMSEFAKKALDVGGSSHKSIHRFVQDLIKNLS